MPLANVSSGSETMEETATVPIMSEQHIKTEVRVKTVFKGEVMIHYLDDTVQYEELCKEIRGICRFTPETVFTIKWVDEENDPCTISSQMELDEAIRLYEVNRDSELVIHDFMEFKFDYMVLCVLRLIMALFVFNALISLFE